MTCRKGILRYVKSWFGNWCNSDERAINEECEASARCCQKKEFIEKIDWSDKNGEDWSTPVKSQGECGACWAFASVASLEAQLNIINNDPNLDIDLSEQMLVSCSNAGDCNGGQPEYAGNFIVNSGIIDENCFPYQESDISCNKICTDWKSRRFFFNKLTSEGITEVLWNNGIRTINIECIKPLIKEYGPIPLVYMGPGTFDKDYIYSCEDSLHNTGHAVLAVGFDDKERVWIVKNSWGSGWGNNGFYKIKYNSCQEFLGPAITQVSDPDFSAVYCKDLGYNFTIERSDKGERGICNLPDGTNVDSWAFFNGKVGEDYSFCSRKGYEMITETDGQNSISRDYAVCIINGQKIAVSDLMGYTNSSEIAEVQTTGLTKKEGNSVIFACMAFAVIIIIFSIMILRLKK
jgi:putative hemolysin